MSQPKLAITLSTVERPDMRRGQDQALTDQAAAKAAIMRWMHGQATTADEQLVAEYSRRNNWEMRSQFWNENVKFND